MPRLHIVRDEEHEETYLVNSMGQECCWDCGSPYPSSHEDWCETNENKEEVTDQ